MSTQWTLRISDDLAAFVDETVKAEGASGRAEIVARALRREQRRLAGERDARIYSEHGEDPDLVAFNRAAAEQTWGEQ